MFPLYQHHITPAQDIRSIAREAKQGLANRKERKAAERSALAVLNDSGATEQGLLQAAQRLQEFDRSATKAIPLFERVLNLGATDVEIQFSLGQLYAKKWEASRPLFDPVGEPNRQYLKKAISHLEQALQAQHNAQAELLLAQLYADHRVPDPERAVDFAFDQMDARKAYLPTKAIILAQVAHTEPKVGGISVVHVMELSEGFKKLPIHKQQRVIAFLTQEAETKYLSKITPQPRRARGSILGLLCCGRS